MTRPWRPIDAEWGRPLSARSYLSIGDVLTLLRQEFPDVTISKIRFLESQGLVNPERTPSGYRKFYEHDVERLRWVLRQQREHFLPLKVIKDRLDDDSTAPAPEGSSNRTAAPVMAAPPVQAPTPEPATDDVRHDTGAGAGRSPRHGGDGGPERLPADRTTPGDGRRRAHPARHRVGHLPTEGHRRGPPVGHDGERNFAASLEPAGRFVGVLGPGGATRRRHVLGPDVAGRRGRLRSPAPAAGRHHRAGRRPPVRSGPAGHRGRCPRSDRGPGPDGRQPRRRRAG